MSVQYSSSTYPCYVIGDTRVCPDNNDILITLRQPLGEEAFDGILEWSQVWVYYLNDDENNKIHFEVFNIIALEGRSLRLRPINNDYCIGDGVRVIDIKPYHALDAVE
mmetsp:Transcript_21481/g.17861  ORF Transcript_21481/g.17861 Transcript_21481/m.17861 type:complete len:108 (+) Transcript_21481:41-364(+)